MCLEKGIKQAFAFIVDWWNLQKYIKNGVNFGVFGVRKIILEKFKKMLDKVFNEICYLLLFFPCIPKNEMLCLSSVVLCSLRSRKRQFVIMFIQVHSKLLNKWQTIICK